MATVRGPTIGLLDGQKEAGQRVDFKNDKFTLAIETKGPRIAWSRGSICPCTPINDQTTQASPNCTLCDGTGFMWFRVQDYVAPAAAGDLTPIQQQILLDYTAVVIRGVITSVMRNAKTYDVLGPWAFGSFNITTRAENRLGYYDRLVCLDSVMPYSQLAEVAADGVVSLRYPALTANLLRSEAQEYVEDIDYKIADTGSIRFITGRGPALGTRVAVHYDHHPVMLVWEHAHAFRDAVTAFKQSTKTTPQGNPQQLPQQALARLEFLPFPRDRE